MRLALLPGMKRSLSARSAGILLHISSLPSQSGIGDLGREVRKFADFLTRAGQTYWQLLPVNPTQGDHSPYNATSAMAGNPLFISIDLLYDNGLLTDQDLEKSRILNSNKVNYKGVEPGIALYITQSSTLEHRLHGNP